MDSDEEDLDALEALADNVDVGEEDLGKLIKEIFKYDFHKKKNFDR